jgi:hypothetical protein
MTFSTTDESIRYLTPDEGQELFDRQARRYLKMSGEEFLRRWEAGEFDHDPDRPDIMRVAMLIPLVWKAAR